MGQMSWANEGGLVSEVRKIVQTGEAENRVVGKGRSCGLLFSEHVRTWQLPFPCSASVQ